MSGPVSLSNIRRPYIASIAHEINDLNNQLVFNVYRCELEISELNNKIEKAFFNFTKNKLKNELQKVELERSQTRTLFEGRIQAKQQELDNAMASKQLQNEMLDIMGCPSDLLNIVDAYV